MFTAIGISLIVVGVLFWGSVVLSAITLVLSWIGKGIYSLEANFMGWQGIFSLVLIVGGIFVLCLSHGLV